MAAKSEVKSGRRWPGHPSLSSQAARRQQAYPPRLMQRGVPGVDTLKAVGGSRAFHTMALRRKLEAH
jgi:hypothetical protein